ncbi:hypothetical protein [Rhizorhabdus sp. FW153]|uniref:hypothetical protein n=1 Tax=Rhizorhabdus sp. FW153 TaxID=3400216 RepID=UPI003CF9149D
MQAPIGYPPPTLVRRRSVWARLRLPLAIIILVAAAAIGSLFLMPSPKAPSVRHADSSLPAAPVVRPPAPESADASPPVVIDVPRPDIATATRPVDGRKANHWHYVPRLGDGPGVIYSRTGKGWDYAMACTPATSTIEIIAVGTGSPGTFDRQSIDVGKVRLMMDATYSPDGGGTISTRLPASHPFFKALDGSAPMAIQLYETRKTIIPVDPEVVRLVQKCRGRG